MDGHIADACGRQVANYDRGGPTQMSLSVMRAAGNMPINTVGSHGGMIGPPTCGIMPVT